MADISKTLKFPIRRRGNRITATAVYSLKASESGSLCEWNSTTGFNFNLPKVTPELKGVFYTFVIKTAATSGTGHGVSPNAVDQIRVPGATPTDNKDLLFVTATDAVGNGFTIECDGKDGWFAYDLMGTFSQEA
jgi:hypothetical protein